MLLTIILFSGPHLLPRSEGCVTPLHALPWDLPVIYTVFSIRFSRLLSLFSRLAKPAHLLALSTNAASLIHSLCLVKQRLAFRLLSSTPRPISCNVCHVSSNTTYRTLPCIRFLTSHHPAMVRIPCGVCSSRFKAFTVNVAIIFLVTPMRSWSLS